MKKEPLVSVFVHYPHHMGTINSYGVLPLSEFIQLGEVAQRAYNNENQDAEFVYEVLERELEKKSKCTFYALMEALTNNGKKTGFKTVLTKLKKNKKFSGIWEEGSFAFSLKGKADCQKQIRKIEAKVASENMDLGDF